MTGWHKIEIRMSDGSGGAGGYNTSDNYLNTENMGWSDDNGSSWKLMMDPGDGSLLRTDGAAAMTVEENISAGRLNSVTLSFGASEAARDLYVAYGPDYGGNELSAWQTTAKVGTIGAGATSYTYNVPASWGTDDNLVLHRTRNVRFCMAGSGDMMDQMIYLAAKRGIADRFHFPGFMRGKEVYECLKDSDVYVMPSVSEPFGISPLEAMQCGTPTIISKQSGCGEILTNCIKVDYWDVHALADAIYSTSHNFAHCLTAHLVALLPVIHRSSSTIVG